MIKTLNNSVSLERKISFSSCTHCDFLCLIFQSCQADLVKDNGHKYFLSVLADPYMPVRTSHLIQTLPGFAELVLASSSLF